MCVNVHDVMGTVEPNSDLGAHNMAEIEHSLNRSKSRLGMHALYGQLVNQCTSTMCE